MPFLSYEIYEDILNIEQFFDDVITSQDIITNFAGIGDSGLNFHIKQSDLDF